MKFNIVDKKDIPLQNHMCHNSCQLVELLGSKQKKMKFDIVN
jgi:hypothetical protein